MRETYARMDINVRLISNRAAPSTEIARLEAQIRTLDSQLTRGNPPAGPRLRSTARPGGVTPQPAPDVIKPPQEPIFEDMPAQRQRLDAAEPAATPEHFNEFGVRKYDLPALMNKLRSHFRGPTASNPRLVNYLAAGSIHGLRPMRYEKRVARNRVVLFASFLFLMLLGILLVFFKYQYR
jgi:hypothetical protein